MSSMADVGCVTRDRPSGLNLYLCLFTNKSYSVNVVNRVNYWRCASNCNYSARVGVGRFAEGVRARDFPLQYFVHRNE